MDKIKQHSFWKAFVLMLIILPTICFSQAKNEELILKLNHSQGKQKVDLLNQISKEFRDYDRFSSLNYANKAYDLAQNLSYKPGVALALKNIGIIWFYLGDNDSATFYYQKAYQMFVQIGDEPGKSACLNNIGLIKQETGFYNEAYEYYEKSVAIDTKLGDEVSMASTLMNMGEVQMAQGKTLQSFALMDKALAIYEKNNDESGVMTVLLNRAAAYDNLKKFDAAYSTINKLILRAKKNGNRYKEAIGYSNRALYLFHKGEIELAKASIDSSLAISDESDDGYSIYNTYNIMADIYSHEHQYQKSNEYLQKVLKQAEAIDNKRMVSRALTTIGCNLMQTNELDKAKGYFGESLSIANSIGAMQEVIPNLYYLSLIEAIMRNFSAADSLNELYTEKALELFCTDSISDGKGTISNDKNIQVRTHNHSIQWITAILLFAIVMLLSLIAFKK